MATTKQPSGLAIARNISTYTFSWKIADADYGDGQQLQWHYHTGSAWTKWTSLGIAADAKEKAVWIDIWSLYWPTKKKFLNGIEFRVRGKRTAQTKDGKTTTFGWSAWSTYKMVFYTPKIPKVYPELDPDYENVTQFNWETEVSDTDNRPFRDVQWQSILVKESNVTDGSKLTWDSSSLGWLTGTGTASNYYRILEDTEMLANNSYTRWFRIRSRGPGGKGDSQGWAYTGCSKWKYNKHVYAIPFQPKINWAKLEGDNWLRVNWTADRSESHPIDYTYVEWAIDTPTTNQQPPASPTWNTARTFRDTMAGDEAFFQIDQTLDTDECLWVRVSAQHDLNRIDSGAYLVASGALATPTDLEVEYDSTTHRATITASNESDVPDSRLAVVMRRTYGSDTVDSVVAVSTTGSGEKEMTVQIASDLDFDTLAFGVYAFQGVATDLSGQYGIVPNMKSAELWEGGAVPVAPTDVSATLTGTPGEVLLKWAWAWQDANRAELSWSQNVNSWESTDEPETYMITGLRQPQWRVSGLEIGVTWYFRIRLAQQTGDEITYGPYSEIVEADLSSTPNVPVLTLSKYIVTQGESLTASWAYSATDGSSQAYAEVCEATVSGNTITYGEVVAHASTAHNAEILNDWEVGSTHYLCVRASSESGKMSGWSDPVSVIVADPIQCEIADYSLVVITMGEDEDERVILALQEMPLTATITGAGTGGTTTLIVERAREYHMLRPDESVKDGFEGETVVLMRQTGESEITINQDDLIGVFDDGASYRLIATVEDGLGQTDTQELEFEVHWTHQAEVPSATVEIEAGAAVITPIAPDGAGEGDVCDIYRLTADLPELIVEGGTYGTKYVDPYPAIGPGHGHRIVDRTVNGDYITEDNTPAWIDLDDTDGDLLDIDYGIIDFAGMSLPFRYNTKLSNSWSKDFEQTKYLGGSIVGDWNPGIERTMTINAVLLSEDAETYQILRRLAEYTGICHVRTQEGSSYSANVQVSDGLGYDTAGKIVDVTLTITRIDPEELDGILYSEWVIE